MSTKASPPPPSSHRTMQPELLRLADQCVKCGYCLPHCPTYALTRNEADSPRGRIALIQGWVSGSLEMSAAMAKHLDGCLTCRACESACPSLVEYGRLIDGAKALRRERAPRWRTLLATLLLQALSRAAWTSRLGRFARLYRSSRLGQLLDGAGVGGLRVAMPYHRLLLSMAATARAPVSIEPAAAEIDLFVGCMGASAQGSAVQATLDVLETLGISVRVSRHSECCGALLRHNGLPLQADRLRERVARNHQDRTLVGLSSACLAELRAESELLDIAEICAYLAQAHGATLPRLSPLRAKVLVHEPCTHRNLLGGASAVYDLLSRVPELSIAPLPGNDTCCGAAGTYLIQQPETALALAAAKRNAIAEQAPDYVVTTNPGCALHLAASVREAGLSTRVCHPIELIARQLGAGHRAAIGYRHSP